MKSRKRKKTSGAKKPAGKRRKTVEVKKRSSERPKKAGAKRRVPKKRLRVASTIAHEGRSEASSHAAAIITSRQTDDQTAIQIVANEAERRRRFMATQSGVTEVPFAGTGSLAADATEVRGPVGLHEKMLKRIAAIEDVIAKLPATTPGIGHNKPPEPIEPAPLNSSEIEEIKSYIRLVKAQPAVPPQPPAEARAAASRLKIFGEKVLAYAAKQADNFVSEAVKTAGKAAPIWALFGNELMALSNSIIEWLRALL